MPAHNDDDDADTDAQVVAQTSQIRNQHNRNTTHKLMRMPLQKVNVAFRISVLVVHAN